MKRLILLVIVLTLVMTGCSAVGTFRQLSDSGGDRLQAYALGRSAYYGVTNVIPISTVELLEADYDAFLAKTDGVVLIEPNQTIEFVNGQARILSTATDDPYGLLGDMLKIFGMYGVEYSEGTGEVSSMYPIPRSLFWEFSDGWRWSRNFDKERLEN